MLKLVACAVFLDFPQLFSGITGIGLRGHFARGVGVGFREAHLRDSYPSARRSCTASE